MPAIPEFVLRKLFVPGSLKACQDGFEFQLNNTLAPVMLTGFGITCDGQTCQAGAIFLKMPTSHEISAASITGEQPFSMTVNTLIGIRVKAAMPLKKLVIHAETREAGALKFSIPLKKAEAATGGQPALGRKIMHALQFAMRAGRARMDPQRPKFHFAPPANWMNDPNGLIFWKGTYHMFYQYNPYGAVWGNIHWGHAVSQDMLHWEHLPIALVPDPNGADSGGCFSGCAVEDDGVVSLIYTGVFPEMQCMARSSADDLVTWKKHTQPLISKPPDGMKVEGFRDPCVWKEGREWRMAVGSGLHGEGGAVLLYASPNLLDWHYLGILYQEKTSKVEGVDTGTMWECPSFFPLGEKWILILSVCDANGPIGTIYYLGEYKDGHFLPNEPARKLDHGAGACFYAPQTFLSGSGERVMFGWLREGRSEEEMKRAGWSGAMSLPRVLSLDTEGGLACAPLAGITMLRGKVETLEKTGQVSRKAIGKGAEICVRVQRDAESWTGIQLAASKAADEAIRIGWNNLNHRIEVDCRKAGGLLSSLPLLKPGPDEVNLHVFVDSSVLEVFVDDRQVISARFYIHEPRSLRVQLSGKALADIWVMV